MSITREEFLELTLTQQEEFLERGGTISSSSDHVLEQKTEQVDTGTPTVTEGSSTTPSNQPAL